MADIQETLITPVASMISAVGESVADAATRLNVAQAEAYKNLPEKLVKAGIIPSFYHMQDVEVELKLTLQIEHSEQSSKGSRGKRKWRLFASPQSAKTQARSRTSAGGSSSLKITFAPGPPPLEAEAIHLLED